MGIIPPSLAWCILGVDTENQLCYTSEQTDTRQLSALQIDIAFDASVHWAPGDKVSSGALLL